MKNLFASLLIFFAFNIQSQTLIKLNQLQKAATAGSVIVSGTGGTPTYTNFNATGTGSFVKSTSPLITTPKILSGGAPGDVLTLSNVDGSASFQSLPANSSYAPSPIGAFNIPLGDPLGSGNLQASVNAVINFNDDAANPSLLIGGSSHDSVEIHLGNYMKFSSTNNSGKVESTLNYQIWPDIGSGTKFTFGTNDARVTYLGAAFQYMATGLKGSASLNFPSTNASSSDLTITVTGAAVGDPVELGLPSVMPAAGSLAHFVAWVSSSNTVTVRFINPGTAIDPNTGTFKVFVNKN